MRLIATFLLLAAAATAQVGAPGISNPATNLTKLIIGSASDVSSSAAHPEQPGEFSSGVQRFTVTGRKTAGDQDPAAAFLLHTDGTDCCFTNFLGWAWTDAAIDQAVSYAYVHGVTGESSIVVAAGKTYAGGSAGGAGIIGVEGLSEATQDNLGTVNFLTGVEGWAQTIAGHANNMVSLRAAQGFVNGGLGGTADNYFGVYVDPQQGIATHNYGIYLTDQGAGANDYSIYSAGGKNYFGGGVTTALYNTTTNCAAIGSAASPSIAACGSAAAGHFSCATTATGATCQVNTTAVTANSEIFVFESDTTVTGTALGVTCNTSTNVLPASRLLASSVAATSFTINLGTVTTNPACFSYHIIN